MPLQRLILPIPTAENVKHRRRMSQEQSKGFYQDSSNPVEIV
jgi:hypothetical protein